MRLHNMPCSSVPMVELARPTQNLLFNQGTEIYPQYGLWMIQLFLLKRRTANGQRSDNVSHHRHTMIEFSQKGPFVGLKCGGIRGQYAENFKKVLHSTSALLLLYYSTWHLSLNGKKCYGKPSISASALAVVQRRHHQDLPFGLRRITSSSLHVDRPCYCAVQKKTKNF